MVAQPQVEKEIWTEDEYFAFEETTFGRWEFDNGEIRAMSGGKDNHNMIAMNIGSLLQRTLISKGCRVYGSDMKIHTGGVNTFPDVAVVCGPRVYHRGRADILMNPFLLVEVLSESTENYDRGAKWSHYQTIETLRDYLLVSPDAPRVSLFSRDADHWNFREISSLDATLFLPSVDVTLALSDVYASIEFGKAGT